MTNLRDFIFVLDAVIDERFPNTIRYVVNSGDYIKDMVMELRENDKKIRYTPYELFSKSDDYEGAIEDLAEQWKSMLDEERLPKNG